MKKRILILLFLLFSSYAFSAVSRYVYVQFETQRGWSDPYLREVEFYSGDELNKATKRFIYDTFDYYAVIWFDDGECAIIQIDNIIVGDREVTDKSLWNLFLIESSKIGIQINSRYETKWKITAKNWGQFIDKRIKY